MSQLYLFTGENTYLLRQEVRSWVQQFSSKHGDQNFLRLDGASLLLRDVLDEVSIAPFLGGKRLVIIDGMPKWTKEEIALLPTQIHPDTILLISDSHPDKRLSGTKELLKVATVKEFASLFPKALSAWIKDTVKVQGSSISDQAIAKLLDMIGSEQDVLANEIDKLTLFAAGREITTDDVEQLVLPTAEQEVWHLTGLLSCGQSMEALLYAHALMSRGEDPGSLWNKLLWMLRSLVSVYAAVKDGMTQPAKIAAATKIPFPTAAALLPLAKAMNGDSLQRFLNAMSQREIDLKTGGLRMSGDASEELSSVIDSFILTFPSDRK